MGRKRKPRTGMMRVRLIDLERLKAIARSYNMSLPDYMAMISRKRKT